MAKFYFKEIWLVLIIMKTEVKKKLLRDEEYLKNEEMFLKALKIRNKDADDINVHKEFLKF